MSGLVAASRWELVTVRANAAVRPVLRNSPGRSGGTHLDVARTGSDLADYRRLRDVVGVVFRLRCWSTSCLRHVAAATDTLSPATSAQRRAWMPGGAATTSGDGYQPTCEVTRTPQEGLDSPREPARAACRRSFADCAPSRPESTFMLAITTS